MEELVKQSMLKRLTLFSEDTPETNQDAAFGFWQQD
jgi:hypothetical protein